MLSNGQIERISDEIYRRWRTCYNCMPFDKGMPVWIVPSSDIDEAVITALFESGVSNEIDIDSVMIDEVIDDLKLSCPSCETPWEHSGVRIGEAFDTETPAMRQMEINVPTINDDRHDFDRLFGLWNQVNEAHLDVIFRFKHCGFLRQNAVAFIGGISRLIQHRGGQVIIDWDSMQYPIHLHLCNNCFVDAFGQQSGPSTANTVPYREDLTQNAEKLISYLKTQWLGHSWINVSLDLRDAIVGVVWEIYANAFEHSNSPIGIFSCGQHYPNIHELKLTVVDFGVGIPANVRAFFKDDPRFQSLSSDSCLKWAFQQGTTTKPNESRGMGLDLLKDFVRLNKGKLEIFSHDGYAVIDENMEAYSTMHSWFEGTIVNITFICDASFYKLSSEVSDEPFF